MEIELIKYPTNEDWLLVKKCTLVTVSKDSDKLPTTEFKQKLLKARHSPIRELRYVFRITDLPYWISVHLCRHIHAQPYVSTQRNDRQDKYDREAARQDAPVTMIWSMNAEELMVIANKRLCLKASEGTRTVVQKMCNLVSKKTPEIAPFLVPMCKYHGGECHEMTPCYTEQ